MSHIRNEQTAINQYERRKREVELERERERWKVTNWPFMWKSILRVPSSPHRQPPPSCPGTAIRSSLHSMQMRCIDCAHMLNNVQTRSKACTKHDYLRACTFDSVWQFCWVLCGSGRELKGFCATMQTSPESRIPRKPAYILGIWPRSLCLCVSVCLIWI